MKYTIEEAKLLKKEQLAKGIFRFTVFSPAVASVAKAGQFANISVAGKILRRPISICELDPQFGRIRFVFEVRGDGTAILSQAVEGDIIDLIAPLGHGFDLGDPSLQAVFVGGGIGVPPLLEAAKSYGRNASVYLGFRSEEAMILVRDFAVRGAAVRIATDDGSLGYHGFVTDLLKEKLQNDHVDIIYACGPRPMLKLIAAMAREQGVACQVSLEERMGCGIGACLVCACPILKDGVPTYRHVCKEGPVFNAEEVVWDA
ncbi:MAG: dihydroorotate dehydrogenase electron transfer subunit [Oscillospiraceae bacterium]|nr:dihydroorotate dehydrogenase electron transfer subunit [Oscillospiraceae bacterium]